MKVHNKIGFHTAVGGNPTGIGDYLRRLDAADIPFFIKAADGMTGLADAQQIIHDRGEDAPPHVLVYRRSVPVEGSRPPSGNPDVPDYEKEPKAAAAEHWAWHKQHLPPELDPDLVWIETINELRKEVEWADWIGEFAFHTGQIALNEGYKFAAFGYSTGTPDEGAWETDGMLQYLELCQQHPEQLAVALHEYSLKTDDIWFLRGDHIGRFEKLFAICDKHRVRRPKVLITEWGWTHERVPRNVDKAMQDINEVGELYARHPEILGAAIWYLGPGFGGIANRAQKLIEPVTEFTIAHTFDVSDPEEETSPPPPSPRPELSTTSAAGQPNARYLKDVTIPDDTPMASGQTFAKIWLVENNGDTTWNDSYHLIHTAGTPMSDDTSHSLPPLGPDEQGEVSVPMRAPRTPGSFFSDWRFQDENGALFGDIIYARILVEEMAGAMSGPPDSKFVADVTIPDDSTIEPGEAFTKTWRVRNSGGQPWGSDYTLDFIGGTNMAETNTVPLPPTPPGNETEISIRMKAPQSPGMYFADWRMKDENGEPFGEVVYVRIIVPSPAGDSLAPPLSQRDPLWAEQRLGHAGSPKTIGEWGCLLTCYAMFANSCGHEITPAQLNHAMVSKGGFIDRYVTKWNALTEVYNSVIYNGKMEQSPQVPGYIDASLNAGNPVSVQVDFTRDTPYTANDQHWVLIVGKDGDDYRINDPWLAPAQETSLRDRYGRTGQPIWKAIRSAVFYRCRDRDRRDTPPPGQEEGKPGRLERGVNVNPDAPHSNPMDSDVLKGMDWVRFVFKIDAREDESERGDINAAFNQYNKMVREYNDIGVKSLIVLNQETIWGNAPWSGNGDWAGYADQLAAAARRIAAKYKRYGAEVAYEIWNEGDLQNNPASVFVPPEPFATVLQRTADAIRDESPDSPLVFGGLASGPSQSIDYLKACKQALNGPWPVDAIGIHPYGRWATQAPFDWGQQFGTLGQAFDQYRANIGDIPFWITEIGVAADNEIGPAHYPAIGRYIRDVFQHVEERHTDLVPVAIWFAWSDWMRNAGIVDRNGNRKPHVYSAFRAVRNRELGVM